MTGIVTITGDSNYGNRLQNYAVQSVLKNLGVESTTIFVKKSLVRIAKNFIKVLIGRREISAAKRKRNKAFRRFNKNISILNIYENSSSALFTISWIMQSAARIRFGTSRFLL